MMKRMAMLIAVMVAASAMAEQVEISLPDSATVRLDWQAVPGQTYRVMTTTNLVDHPWQDAVPGGMVAGSVIGAYTEPLPARAAFFRVQKEDTNPPEIESLIPVADAIAVQSNATLLISVSDETDIDTNSIVLTVAGWQDMTLATPFVTYSNGTISFVPPSALGGVGDTVTNVITVSDTLGNTLSNYVWTFQLARPPDATDDFLPLTAPPEGQSRQSLAAGVPESRIRTLSNVKPLDAPGVYEIVSVTSNTVVFSYQGAPPDMPAGKRLVSFDAAHPFYRQAVSNLLNEAQSQMTVWTVDILLTDLAAEGSLSSANFTAADPAPLHIKATTSDLNLLHVEFGDDLSGTVLFDDAGLKLHLPQASWGFVGDVDVAFDLFFSELRSLDASANGTLTLDLSPEALFYQAVNGDGEFPLVQPVTKLFGAMVGPVPVWVEVIMELNAGYEYSASVSGVVNTRVHAEKDLTFYVRLRENQWTHGVDNPPIVLESDPIYWQLEGTANAKVYVQPKLTVLVYSLAGLWADIQPYAEFDGRYQLNPLEYDLGLYLGLSSTLGIESRVWYAGWGDKPEWQLFDNKWSLWSAKYPQNTAPWFTGSFPNRSVAKGGSVTLSGAASGNPAPQYRWYFNGERISGSFGATYTISQAQTAHQGTYAVQAYNSHGTAEASCNVSVFSPYRLEYVAGGGQTYRGGGMPLPMVFRVKDVAGNRYLRSFSGLGLTMTATATVGYQDAAFNNLNNYGGLGSEGWGGYYYVPPNTGAAYTLDITVKLFHNETMIDSYPLSMNITGGGDFELRYISGDGQTYGGGGMPMPMVFKVVDAAANADILSLSAFGLTMTATASVGYQDAEFNNLNNYGGLGAAGWGGYYYVPPNTGAAYTLDITVKLFHNGTMVDSYPLSMNITGSTADYELEYVSGDGQTYGGGGMHQPMVFRVKDTAANSYLTSLNTFGLSMTATASIGYQDAAFNNLNDYGGLGSEGWGGYYYVPPNTGAAYTLDITVKLFHSGALIDSYPLSMNITGQ